MRSTCLKIDVRIAGTSCGEITLLPNEKVRLFHPKNFKGTFVGKSSDWAHPCVRRYLDAVVGQVNRTREAAFDAALLVQMWGERKMEPLRGTSAIDLAGMPFQFPLPIAGRKIAVLPRGAAGHADVVARSGGRCVRMFEVKKPGAPDTGHALAQAVAYCAALECMLESDRAPTMDILGYSTERQRIALDAVAFVEDSVRYPLHGDRLLRWPWMRQVGLHGKCSYVARANRGMASKWIERGEVRREPRSDCASGVELGGEVS